MGEKKGLFVDREGGHAGAPSASETASGGDLADASAQANTPLDLFVGLDTATVERMIERWAQASAERPSTRLRIPIHHLRQEALELATLVQKHWMPARENGHTLPGLGQQLPGGPLTPQTSTELQELQFVLGAMDARLSSGGPELDDEAQGTANRVLSEMKAALSFLLEDGQHPGEAQQLARMRRRYSRDNSMAGRVEALTTFAELCHQHRRSLKALGKVQAQLGKRGLAAAQALSERASNGRLHHYRRLEETARRNRIARELFAHMREVRRTVHYVFRDHPRVLKLAQSKYEKASRRRRKSLA